ncbi:MAG: class II glutamine amidotransferase [Deltaproteobacteria bacterium]|nr:class II glutamine amidotransferase [Deltaproteobacteria bacterium]
MARLTGFIANRPDLGTRVAAFEQEALTTRKREDSPWGWGVGFFHSGEPLLKRRCLDDRRELRLADMIADVRSDILVSHIRCATVGGHTTDNTHPFRYRQWMFAGTGTVDRFGALRDKLYDSLPSFLQRSVRGETDSELVFHLLLEALHEAGELDRPPGAPETCAGALRSALVRLERICAEVGADACKLNVLVATPEYLCALRGASPMALRMLAGRADFEPLFAEHGPGQHRLPDLEPCRLCLVASDFDAGVPPGWSEVGPDEIVVFTRTENPRRIAALPR